MLSHGVGDIHTRRDLLETAGVVGAAVLGVGVTPGVAGAEELSGRFVLATGRGVDDGDVAAIEDAGLDVVHRIDPIGRVVAEGTETDVEATGFEYAPDIRYSYSLPHDALDLDSGSDGDCYDLQRTDAELRELKWDTDSQRVPEAHETTRGDGVRVAVIDTGVDGEHPDLAHAVDLELSRAFTADSCGGGRAVAGGHGTHVAGIVAANDDGGVHGVAPACEIVDCRVFPASGRWDCSGGPDYDPDDLEYTIPPGASFGNILQAVVYAAQVDCDVANMSLGVGYRKRSNDGRFYGQSWARATAYATAKGTLLVSSAGNGNVDLQEDGEFVSLLTEAPNVMTVAAAAPLGHMWGPSGHEEPPWTPAGYSNEGTNAIDVGAGGGDFPFGDESVDPAGEPWYRDLVLSTVPHDLARADLDDECRPLLPILFGPSGAPYRFLAGTSMASPQAAGVAALVKSVDPDAPPNEVRSIVETAARDVGERDLLGQGYVDAVAAVEKASGGGSNDD